MRYREAVGSVRAGAGSTERRASTRGGRARGRASDRVVDRVPEVALGVEVGGFGVDCRRGEVEADVGGRCPWRPGGGAGGVAGVGEAGPVAAHGGAEGGGGG